MTKIKKIIVGTNNLGKLKEISDLLPKKIIKYHPKEFNILSPRETGKSFEKNSLIKAKYFSKKTNLICIADDSGLQIDILGGEPGIYSSRWAGKTNNFNIAIKKIYQKMKKNKKNWEKLNTASFVCCLTLYFPNGKYFTTKGVVKGKISISKKGKNGFGYDPIFIPIGYKKTFGEMEAKLKMSIDHRYKAFSKIKKFFFNKL